MTEIGEQRYKELEELLDQVQALGEFGYITNSATIMDIRRLLVMSYTKGYSKGAYDALIDEKLKMTFPDEIEKVKSEIKVLEKKLSFLEELERTKSPVEEAFKEFYGAYPITDIADTSWDSDGWVYFEAGYNAAYKEKVAEEPEELKTLYQMLDDEKWENYFPGRCETICNIVKDWMSQYTDNVMSGEYLEGYNGCLDVLKENLK